jgi:hypothetical protein
MLRTEYFRRQSDICIRLFLVASSEDMATRLIAMAQDFHAKAGGLEAHTGSPLASIPYNPSQNREA